MFEKIKYVADYVAPNFFHSQVTTLLLLVCIAVVAVAAYYFAKAVLLLSEHVILRSPTEWDDDLLNQRFTRAV